MQIPRLHCLIHRKLAVHDFLQGSPIMEVNYRRSLWISALIFYHILTNLQFNSLLVSLVLPHLTFLTFNLSFFQPNPHLVKEIREALFRHLSALLGNDGLAGHFMLLHLLSKVHARVDDVAMGKLSLNLAGLSKENVSVFEIGRAHV